MSNSKNKISLAAVFNGKPKHEHNPRTDRTAFLDAFSYSPGESAGDKKRNGYTYLSGFNISNPSYLEVIEDMKDLPAFIRSMQAHPKLKHADGFILTGKRGYINLGKGDDAIKAVTLMMEIDDKPGVAFFRSLFDPKMESVLKARFFDLNTIPLNQREYGLGAVLVPNEDIHTKDGCTRKNEPVFVTCFSERPNNVEVYPYKDLSTDPIVKFDDNQLQSAKNRKTRSSSSVIKEGFSTLSPYSLPHIDLDKVRVLSLWDGKNKEHINIPALESHIDKSISIANEYLDTYMGRNAKAEDESSLSL
jgi:hypothetical protein